MVPLAASSIHVTVGEVAAALALVAIAGSPLAPGTPASRRTSGSPSSGP